MSAPAPQVVARYGYMDIVDHGPAFANSVIDHVQKQLERYSTPQPIAPSSAIPVGENEIVALGAISIHIGPPLEVCDDVEAGALCIMHDPLPPRDKSV